MYGVLLRLNISFDVACEKNFKNSITHDEHGYQVLDEDEYNKAVSTPIISKRLIKNKEGKAVLAPKFIELNQFTSKTDYDRWIEANTYVFDAPKAFWETWL